MTLEHTVARLQVQLTRLVEALEALSTTVEEDRPRRGDVVLAASLADSLLALRGFIEDARAAAADAHGSVTQQRDMVRFAQALTAAQEGFHRFASALHADLMSYERLDDLVTAGRERGREWADWTGVVTGELEQCRSLSDEVRNGLFLCWQELVERTVAGAVSIKNTCVGQQIVSPELRATDEALAEEMT
jgi:hypothetical protein